MHNKRPSNGRSAPEGGEYFPQIPLLSFAQTSAT